MDFDLGARLRRARGDASLSQRALSRRCGISNATISLIESGKLNPSVSVLKRIIEGIPLDLATFFAEESERAEPVALRAEELLEIGSGAISYRQVGRDLSGRSLQILHEHYASGADTGKVALLHEGQEGGVVIRGRLELTVDGERHLLGPGDAYYFDSSRPHRFRNLGPDECELVSACTPPSV